MEPLVLLGRPVLNAAYRRRLVETGLDPATPELNPEPAPGSERSTCRRCHAPIWIGPQQQKVLHEALTKHAPVSIECLLCGYLHYIAQESTDVIVTSLSDD